jgi:hypothetical protein
MQNIEFPNLEFDNINFELLNIHNGTSKFDLTFTIKNNESTLSIEYNSDIFEEDNIKSFSESYFEILKSLIKNPKESISKVNIISENQYNIAFNLFNNIPK